MSYMAGIAAWLGIVGQRISAKVLVRHSDTLHIANTLPRVELNDRGPRIPRACYRFDIISFLLCVLQSMASCR